MLYRGPRRSMTRFLLVVAAVLLALVVDKQKGNKHHPSARPVQPAGILSVLDHLADEGQRDVQGQADCDDERRREEHGIRPEDVAEERGGRIYLGRVSKGSMVDWLEKDLLQ